MANIKERLVRIKKDTVYQKQILYSFRIIKKEGPIVEFLFNLIDSVILVHLL